MPLAIPPIGIAGLCVLAAAIITLAFLPLMTKQSSYVPPPQRGSWAPPYTPGTLPSVPPTSKKVCLPGTLGYNGLVSCSRQSDCTSCTDNGKNTDALECVTISGTSNQLVDPTTQQLNPPVNVHLYRKGNGLCSGRGTQKSCDDPNAPYNCKDYWCDCGTQYTHAKNDVTNCDIQLLPVTAPGSYCLPSYVNACNPYTSEAVLSNVGSGSQWLCECKYPDSGLFVQNAEGTDCSVPIACGSQQPLIVGGEVVQVLSYQNPDSQCTSITGSTDWKLCPSYPNQLVSADRTQAIPCPMPTTSTSVPLDDGKLAYVEITPSLLADPACVVAQYNNKCTTLIATNGAGEPVASQVLRGSGSANDPLLSRIWPPYPEVLPMNMQRCPDGWSGDGTPKTPCVDGKGFSLSYLDALGQWNGKFLNVQELRNVGYNGPSAVPCTSDKNCDAATQVCLIGPGVCAPKCNGSVDCQNGVPCVNGVCNAVEPQTCGSELTAVGVPGTLGAIPWRTVNSSCQQAPTCVENSLTLQQIPRSLSTPTNIFPVTSDAPCASSDTSPAPVCTCPLDGQDKSCQHDGDCGAGGACRVTPIFPQQSCKGNSECTGSNQFCWNSVCSVGVCKCTLDGKLYNCSVPPSSTPEVCGVVNGVRRRPYDGSLDGPPIDSETGNPLGAACGCNGYTTDSLGNTVPLVAGPNWTCIPDPCFAPGTTNKYNPYTSRCDCSTGYYSWNSPGGAPSCQPDPCAPNGVTSSLSHKCNTDSDCVAENAAVCRNNKCYLVLDQPCDSSTDVSSCDNVVPTNNAKSVQCLEMNKAFTCGVEDPTRPYCNVDTDCALGICNTDTNLCTGGCICGNQTDPFFTDANPLHSACTNPCKFNFCGSNGVCSVDNTGKASCTCNPGYAGDSCEKHICVNLGERCSTDSECCDNHCAWYPFTNFFHKTCG